MVAMEAIDRVLATEIAATSCFGDASASCCNQVHYDDFAVENILNSDVTGTDAIADSLLDVMDVIVISVTTTDFSKNYNFHKNRQYVGVCLLNSHTMATATHHRIVILISENLGMIFCRFHHLLSGFKHINLNNIADFNFDLVFANHMLHDYF